MSSTKRLAREILDARRLALGHATSPQLTSSAVDGGGIDFRDAEGNPIAGIGVGDDGGLIIDYTGGPKPPKPSPPTVTADAGIFRVEWDGSFVNEGDEGVLATSDTDRVEIHASMDENFVPDRVESFGGAFATLDGGSFTLGPLPEAGTYYFRLVARSKSAQFSEPSDRVEQELAITSIDLEITDAWLTGEAAQNTADGKNSIFRGPDEPVEDPDQPFKDGDIWFEMTEDGKSIPNIWDEDAGAWVANDDYRQSEIERVQDELRQELDDIVIDGSGTKNFYQADEPTEGMREGDLWFDVSDNNKPYIYQGGEWITVRDSFAQPGAATEIVGATLANAVNNQWSNIPGFSYTVQTLKAEVPTGAPSGGAKLVIPFQGTVDDSGVPVIAGSTVPTQGLPVGVTGSLLVKSAGVAPTAKLHVRFQGGPWPDGFDYSFDLVAEPYTTGGSTHRIKWDTAQDDTLSAYAPLVESIGFALEVNVSSTEGSFVNFNTGNRLTGRLQVPGPGVANEAITTEKIAAGAITAESGIIGSINAGTITVGEMDGARIKAGTVDADTVLVESSIGSTLIKDGAILTDHIKAGAITAESGIIGSIDANVITVGKIMGNQLDADAINGKTITGATIRTASSGSRVELTHNGLRQYNSLGQVIADLTQGQLSIAGDFHSGVDGGARVSIVDSMWDDIMAPGAGDMETPGVSYTGAGAGVRVGVDGADGLSIYHLPYGSGASSAVIESPGGLSGINMHSSGFTVMGGLDSEKIKSNGRVFTFKGGSSGGAAVMQSFGPSGNLRTTVGSNSDPGVVWVQALDSSGYEASGAQFSSNGAATFSATDRGIVRGDTLIVRGNNGVDVMGVVGNLTLTGRRVQSQTIWSTNTDDRPVYINQSTGSLGKGPSSSLRYKQEVERAPRLDSILDVDPATWKYTHEVEAFAEAEAARAAIGIGPLPADVSEVPDAPRRHYGAIAEQVDDLGLSELVCYDAFGRPDALKYELFGVALIPVIRSQRDRIEALESRVAALEEA